MGVPIMVLLVLLLLLRLTQFALCISFEFQSQEVLHRWFLIWWFTDLSDLEIFKYLGISRVEGTTLISFLLSNVAYILS